MISLVLSDPLAGLDLPSTMTLGPFESVRYEGGWFYGDDVAVAEIFQDMLGNVIGHPAAGAVFAPRTFSYYEKDAPEYPGKGYERVSFEATP
jgi:hypothetical protein